VKLIAIYKCLGDETRLRILSLLALSPLCVCHLQRILGKSQVIVSQHLAYLRGHKLVSGQRYQNWMIYSLAVPRPVALDVHLKCLQDALQNEAVFKKDFEKLEKLRGSKTVQALLDEGCCKRPALAGRQNAGRKKTATS